MRILVTICFQRVSPSEAQRRGIQEGIPLPSAQVLGFDDMSKISRVVASHLTHQQSLEEAPILSHTVTILPEVEVKEEAAPSPTGKVRVR